MGTPFNLRVIGIAVLLAVCFSAGVYVLVQGLSEVAMPGAPTPPAVDAGKLRDVAEGWVGVPHRIGGSTRAGIDCSGLALELLTPYGVELPRRAEEMRQTGIHVGLDQVRAGDLVFFSTARADGLKGHVGVALGDGEFVHATASKGVIISSLNGFWWGPRFIGARRVLP